MSVELPENVGPIGSAASNHVTVRPRAADKRFHGKQFRAAAPDGPTFAPDFDVQILLGSDPSGAGRTDAGEGFASPERFEGEQELLDDFLSRLQSIIRGAPAAPRSADDTLPSRRRAGGTS